MSSFLGFCQGQIVRYEVIIVPETSIAESVDISRFM